jgi:hypothetical protein
MPEKRKMRRSTTRSSGGYGTRSLRETGTSVAQVADDLGIPKGTLANLVDREQMAGGEKLDPRGVGPERLRQLEKRSPSCAA